MAFYDSEGNEVQVVSQEDLETLEREKNEALEKAQEELRLKEEELEKLKSKDLNFSNLRQQKDHAEKQVETLKSEIDEKLNNVKKEVFEGVLKDHYSEILKNLSSDDEDLKKKIEFHYNRLNDPATSKSEVDKKLRDAWALATHQDAPNTFNSSVISSGYAAPFVSSVKKNFSQDEKDLARRMASAGGLTLDEKDFN